MMCWTEWTSQGVLTGTLMIQVEAREILKEYTDLFAKDDLHLGKTSVVKHKITLKERVQPIKE